MPMILRTLRMFGLAMAALAVAACDGAHMGERPVPSAVAVRAGAVPAAVATSVRATSARPGETVHAAARRGASGPEPLLIRASGDSDWLARLGGSADGQLQEVARAVDVDDNGAVFVVGTLGPDAGLAVASDAQPAQLPGGVGTDAFVALLDAGGRLRWAQRLGGAGEEAAYDVVADGSGGAWVCGTFTGSPQLGPATLTAQGTGANGFALRVSADGAIGRVLHIGPEIAAAQALVVPGECAVDAAGRLYVAGSYFGAPRVAGRDLPAAPAGQSAGFLAAYERDGRPRWALGLVGSTGLAWRGVAVAGDGSGDVFGIGQFCGRVRVGERDLDSSAGSGSSVWLARFDADGRARWGLSPVGEAYGRGVRAIGGDLVVSGAFCGSLGWPGLPATASNGGQDLFAARLDGNGTPRWSSAVGGALDDEGAEIAVDDGGSVYLGGSFLDRVVLGPHTLISAGSRDVLVARLDGNGQPRGGRRIGGSGDDVGYALEVSPGGWIAWAGIGRGSVDDGALQLAAVGSHDAVFGLLGSAEPPAAAVAVVSTAVSIPQRGGGTLSARVYAPSTTVGRWPVLSLLPGGGAPIDSVFWAAEGLAARGYVVIVTQPASGGSLSAYHLAAVSGIDFLASAANPYAARSDAERVGVAGWSLGARALSRTQEEDLRVDALVGWDNLAVVESGDVGSPNCAGTVPTTRRLPRVPAMGQALDFCGPLNETPDDKQYAYAWWRANAQPAMQIVLAGSDHFVWSGTTTATRSQADALYYTLAWFDRWLKQDSTARARLLARSVDGRSLSQVLSPRFRSAAGFDGVECADLRTGCR